MKTLTYLTVSALVALNIASCTTKAKKTTANQEARTTTVAPVRPSDEDLMAFKVYHHMRYMVTTAEQAGGTNKLLHTKKLPTEGTDPVVTPALDHLYSKAVIDLTEGPVTVTYPDDIDDRYWSIHVTDQEHYTIFDEIKPVGSYTFIRKGSDMKTQEGAKIIECPGDYPHLFIRIQVKTPEDMVNTLAIQERISLEGNSKTLSIDNYIKHTIETHDVYAQNKELLAASINFTKEDYLRVSNYIGTVAPKFGPTGNIGLFGPIDSKEPNANDHEYRAAAIVGHLGLPVHHAYYGPFFTNCNDELLNGDNVEVFTLPYKPEGVELFWSVTRYSALTRNTLPGKNDLINAFNTEPDSNGNITITFSAEDPQDGTYWMPVNKGEPYYFVVRYYKPDVNNLPKKPCS